MAIIYHVTGPDDRGPFREDGVFDTFGYPRKFFNLCKYPSPIYDPLIGRSIRTEEQCGCKTHKELLLWFGSGPAYEKLVEAQGKIHILDVPERYITEGTNQVLYVSKHAKKLGEVPIEQIHEVHEHAKQLAKPAGE